MSLWRVISFEAVLNGNEAFESMEFDSSCTAGVDPIEVPELPTP